MSDKMSFIVKKKKPPVVRQTLTSKYRLLKANPLLMFELAKKLADKYPDRKKEFLLKPLTLKDLAPFLGDDTVNWTNLDSFGGLSKPLVSKSQPPENGQIQPPQPPENGPSYPIDNDENKENIEMNISNHSSSSSYDDLQIKPDSFELIKTALSDLLQLIFEGHSVKKCENWLRMMKQKCENLVKEPQYWECRSALDERKWIHTKKKTTENNDLLHEFLQKLHRLDIKDEGKILQDSNQNVCNKSTVIKFAVQEKVSKGKKLDETLTLEKQLIATPVRRSTRLSRSKFTSTPTIKIYSSLNQIDNSLRNKLQFKCNKALKD